MKRIFIGFLISVFILSQGYCATGWDKTKPAGTTDGADIDTNVTENFAALDLGLSYLRQGCKLTYSSASSLSVGAGSLVVSNSAGTIRLMLAKTSAISTNWNVATNGLDAGSESANQTYYIYAIASAVTDTEYTVKVSTNSSVPAGVTYYKRLGSFYNDSSSNITQIVNDDNSGDIAYMKGQGNYYKVDTGTVALPASTDTAISFSFTFAAAPVVVVTNYNSSATGELYQAYTRAISTTGATLRQCNGNASTGHWYAIGQVLAQ